MGRRKRTEGKQLPTWDEDGYKLAASTAALGFFINATRYIAERMTREEFQGFCHYIVRDIAHVAVRWGADREDIAQMVGFTSDEEGVRRLEKLDIEELNSLMASMENAQHFRDMMKFEDEIEDL